MQKWEYLRVRCYQEYVAKDKARGIEKEYWGWFADVKGDQRLEGLDVIFAYYGNQGWELVNVTPVYWEGHGREPKQGYTVETL